MMDKKELEIMAPAGNFECLQAAIQGGADSVYFGVGKLNMRSHSANNFAPEDLQKVVEICRKAGVKSYLTLNICLYPEDIEDAREALLAAKQAGVSAVIASDMAAILMCREIGLEVHISTQLSISNAQALKFYAQWADVVVLARELNLGQVKHIRDYRAGADQGSFRPIGPHRDVRPRCLVYGYQRKMLFESARLRGIGQSGSVLSDMPSRL